MHQHAFGCNPSDNEVTWWIESQPQAHTYSRSFLFVNSELGIEQNNKQNGREFRSEYLPSWVDKETLYAYFVFVGKRGLCPSLDWVMFSPKDDKRLCNKY